MKTKVERTVRWNCRGVANREFVVDMKDIMREFRPKIIIHIEPKISDAVADRVCKDLGKKQWIKLEARGFSRGFGCCGKTGRSK